MLLYHASRNKFDRIKRNQATKADGLEVPAGELQNKIYLTPNLGFALAMTAGPNGITSINNGAISFERADIFNPEDTIYIYECNSDYFAPDKIEYIDQDQYALDEDEIVPVQITEYKAKDVFVYYRLVEWVHPQLRK